MTADLDKTDPNFVSDLLLSKHAVRRVAAWLTDKGYQVILRPTIVRPSPDVRMEYSDDGDLGIVLTVEVKRRMTIPFHSRADFPYPDIIVDVCHTFDNRVIKPYAYVILNADMSCAVVIMTGKTRLYWSKVKKFDTNAQRLREYYVCPLEHVEFRTLEISDDRR